MAEKDLGRALHEAVQDAMRDVRESGETTPHEFWNYIKEKVAGECPIEYEQARKNVEIMNDGKFDENKLDQYLDTLQEDYKNKLAGFDRG